MDTPGHLLALHVAAASAEDRARVGRLAGAVQEATGDGVTLACVDQGHTGERAAQAARAHGIEPEVVKLPEAKKGFVLPPRRWVVERCCAWITRSRRLARDYRRSASTLADMHRIALTCPMLRQVTQLATVQNSL